MAWFLFAVPFAGLARSAQGWPDGAELLRDSIPAVAVADGKASELSADDLTLSVYCTDYVSGFLDGLALVNTMNQTLNICLPNAGITNDQAVRIVVKYLRDNPAELHKTARSSLLVSFALAFPCETMKP
jgi:hypothetical protein